MPKSKPRRAKQGAGAKNKGSARERWVAKILSKWWGSSFKRTPQSGGSALAEEWRLAGDVATLDRSFPFHVEAKNQEDWHLSLLFTSRTCPPWKWWGQACRQAHEDDAPLLIFKRNFQPVWVMMENRVYDQHQADVPENCILLVDPEGVEVIVFLLDALLKTDPAEWRKK